MTPERKEESKTTKLMVTRIKEEEIYELDSRIGELWSNNAGDYVDDAELITDDMLNVFSSLITGYNAAWDETDRLSAALEEAEQAITVLHEYNHRYAGERDNAVRELAEAQQTIARQREVIDWYESGGSMGELLEEGEVQP